MDVFYFSDFSRSPLLSGTKGITTVHDLVWKIYPQYHEQKIVKAHSIKLEKTINHGDTIIVDSMSTKKDLVKYFPKINKEKIQVVYPGIGEQFKTVNNDKELKNILKKYRINFGDKFFLYVGAIEPRKNLVLAINIFNELIKDNKFSDFKFIITGRAGWKNENVYQSIKQLGLENKVRFTGFVVDEDLPYLYNAA
ncbi:MAG: group 1 glycosyl transferase, partial [uncultured bacterium]